MMPRLGSLRTRLVLAFMLVSVPPMLVAAYVAARIISDAFDQNVEQWLGDTTRFFKLEVGEAQSDANNIAKIVAKRLSEPGIMSSSGTPSLDFDLFKSLGYDLIVIYDDAKKIRYSSTPIEHLSSMPTETINSVFAVTMAGRHILMAGSVEPTHDSDGPFYVLVATAIDPDFLHSIKVGDLIILKSHVTCAFTTSLEVQVDVFSEEILTGARRLTSTAFLTFVAIDRAGAKVRVPPLLAETDEERRVCDEARGRRELRLKKRRYEI